MIPVEQRTLRYFDTLSFSVILVILSFSLIFIYSATYTPEEPFSLFFKKQCLGVFLGLILYSFGALLDYRSFMKWGYLGYFATIGLLVLTLIKGSIGMGAQRWINIGLCKIQPSELIKLFFPAFVSYALYSDALEYNHSLRHILKIMFFLVISFFLIRKQPDLGTALLTLISGLILCWLYGVPKKIFTYGFLCVILAAPLLWHTLHDYQKKRIYVFLGQEAKKTERYQIEQARIAIGSGNITGKGILQGTQTKLRFLPEGRTDFIFAVLAEEWGFIGTSILLLLYALLFIRSFFIIHQFKNPNMQILGSGIVIYQLLAMFINIGMVLELLPAVGIPLPLMSYGITHLITSMMSFGVLQNLAMHRVNCR